MDGYGISNALRFKARSFQYYRRTGIVSAGIKDIIREAMDRDYRKSRYARFLSGLSAYVEKNYGIRFSDDTPPWSLTEIFLDNIYDSIGEFIPGKGDTVVDVGAQFGDYSLLCSRYYGCSRVIAFEPLSGNFRVLRKNLELNSAANVEAVNAAVGDGEGYITIGHDGLMASAFGGPLEERVKMVTLDSQRLRPDIMKVDVEGYEMHVLRGACSTIEANMPRLIVETHSLSLRKSVTEFLTGMGYRKPIKGRKVMNRVMGEVMNLYFLPGS